MKTKNLTQTLTEDIAILQARQSYELQLLKEQFHYTYDSLKPINLIKNVFKDVTASPVIKGTVVNNLIGLAAGFLSRKLLLGSNHGPVRNILGGVLQFVVTNFITKKPDTFATKQLN